MYRPTLLAGRPTARLPRMSRRLVSVAAKPARPSGRFPGWRVATRLAPAVRYHDRARADHHLSRPALRDIVVFPHMIVPLFVGREKSILGARGGDEGRQADPARRPSRTRARTIPAATTSTASARSERAAAPEIAGRHRQGAGRGRLRVPKSRTSSTIRASSRSRPRAIEAGSDRVARSRRCPARWSRSSSST